MSNAKQNVLVVGGGTGIGEAVAKTFARRGDQVVVAGRRQEVLDGVCQAFSAESGESKEGNQGTIQAHTVDVADRASVAALVEWFGTQVGDIHILVNAAGINIKDRSMATMDPEGWDRVMSVNATGAYNLMAAILPQMRKRADGTIINVSSIAGKRALELGGIAYCASKFAMTALGTAVAQEEAPNGIRVTNVYPGEVDTPLLLQRPKPVTEEHRARMLQPQDVADVVLTICNLPARAHVPEVVIKPRLQTWF